MTSYEEKLIKRYLTFYQDLANGVLEPNTPAQKHFVDMCHDKADPETEHERAYKKYIELSNFKTSIEKLDDNIPDTEPGNPNEGWFTRDDWNKLHPDRGHR